jgi:hypothetical protein
MKNLNETDHEMNLRDFFATSAFQVLLRNENVRDSFDARNQIESAAKRAYICADAMMKARESKS